MLLNSSNKNQSFIHFWVNNQLKVTENILWNIKKCSLVKIIINVSASLLLTKVFPGQEIEHRILKAGMFTNDKGKQ